MLKFVQLTLLFCISLTTLAQYNAQTTFEKKYNAQQEILPEWAQMMYAENADVGAVINAYETYYNTHDFVKDKHTQFYKRWLRQMKRDINGYQSGIKDWATAQQNNKAYLTKIEQNLQKNSLNQWECIGPYDFDIDAASRSYAPGAAHVYTVEQSATNTDILYAGTATAGLWKTTNKGNTWYPLTNDYLLNSIRSIEIDHSNPNTIYFEGGNIVYKSTDGGSTFTLTGNASFQNSPHAVNDIVMHPTNNQELWLLSDDGLYHTTDGGNNWTSLSNNAHQELEYHPTDPNIIYVVKQVGNVTQFYKSTDGGASFVQKTNGWPAPSGGDEQKRTEIAVTPDNPNKVYALATGSANGGSGLYGIYVSTDAGESWTRTCCGPQPAGVPNASTNMNLMGWSDLGDDDGGQYYYDLAFEVSETNEDSLFVGGVNMWYSGDGGVSFNCPSKWSTPDRPNYVHADIHDIRMFGNELWIACDGGIFYSTDGGQQIDKRMTGIEGTDFWGFDAGFWDGDVMLGGTYHNGTLLKDHSVYLNDWLCTGGGDNTLGKVNFGNERKVYDDYGEHLLSGNRTQSITSLPFTQPTWGNTDFAFDPRSPNIIYIGVDNVLWKTTDDGASFTALHSFNWNVQDIAVSWSNPDVIYVTLNPGFWDTKQIWKTTNAGANWQQVTPSNSVLNGNALSPYDIEVSSDDENKIWAARRYPWAHDPSIDGYQVLESSDGGATWQSISTPMLDGENATCIIHQRGSDNGIYLGTRRAVYYRSDNTSDWILFNNDLPASTYSTALIPYYREGKIRNATNRSVYENDLYEQSPPSAQIAVDKFESFCTRDTMYFTDHSALNQNGATWSWQFEGGTPATSNIRMPKVVYDVAGTYDVTLTVTDAYGTSSQTLTDFITVTSECDIDTIPGNALSLQNSGDFALTPPVEMGTTNELTMSAWVKCNGIQPDYTGFIMGNDGNAFGLNVRPNNELGYHWPNGQWYWSSGMTVPTNEWAHVAIVVQPNSITVYLNGEGRTHNISPTAVNTDVSSLYIGSYLGWGSRNFDGLIDEVKIWNRALTQQEVREKMHITAYRNDEPNLTAYYQFNRNIGVVTDRIGSRHATMSGNATRTNSTAPLGGGKAHTLAVNSGGPYNFTGTGVTLDFPTGTSPNGNIVVSRINVPPDQYPNMYEPSRSYWVIRNYGNNATFNNLNSIRFDNIGLVTGANAAVPDVFELYKRASNADGNTWGSSIDNADIAIANADGDVEFSTGLSINSFSQFIIMNNCSADNTDTDNNGIADDCEYSRIDLQVFLEGAYDASTGQMRTELSQQNLIPLQQPYNVAPYNYNGTESLTGMNADMVDWVLIEARLTTDPNSVIDRKAGILLSSGHIRDVNGTSLITLDLPPDDNYYIVIRHRNHLDIMTANALTRARDMSYDFRTGITQAFGIQQQTILSTGQAAMFAGDITQDLSIQVTDYDFWRLDPALLSVYDPNDLTLDGVVQTTDYDAWFINKSKLSPPELAY